MSATATKERPIIFSAPMVNAIGAVRKTMTRRIVKPQPAADAGGFLCCDDGLTWMDYPIGVVNPAASDLRSEWRCPYGGVGDRIWVRETFSHPSSLDVECKRFTGFFRANDSDRKVKWRTPIYMPRWASRITLEITGVKVERLQDISEADAIAEGFSPSTIGPRVTIITQRGGMSEVSPDFVGGIPSVGDDWHGQKVTHVQHNKAEETSSAKEEFRSLWGRINGWDSWEKNPFVWCISFRIPDSIEAVQ